MRVNEADAYHHIAHLDGLKTGRNCTDSNHDLKIHFAARQDHHASGHTKWPVLKWPQVPAFKVLPDWIVTAPMKSPIFVIMHRLTEWGGIRKPSLG